MATKSKPLSPLRDRIFRLKRLMGLSGREIPDFVRIATICDVFGALLERRAYKAPIRGDIAYQMLLDMGPKLDKDLVREFHFASALRLEESV